MRGGVGVSAWCGCARLYCNGKQPMKILPFILTAAILAGTAMAEPAPGTNPPEVLTKDESAALIQSHIDRLDRLEPVTLNQDERPFLTKYREEAAAQA